MNFNNNNNGLLLYPDKSKIGATLCLRSIRCISFFSLPARGNNSWSAPLIDSTNKYHIKFYSVSSPRGGVSVGNDGAGNSFEMVFTGVDAIDSNFVFEQLDTMLSPELTYYSEIRIFSTTNMTILCEDLESISYYMGQHYRKHVLNRLINSVIISKLTLYRVNPELVDVQFSLYVGSRKRHGEFDHDRDNFIINW